MFRSIVDKCGVEVLDLLKETGSTCAHLAAMNGRLENVKYLMEAKGEKAGVEHLSILDNDEQSTAFLASFNGHLDVLKYINEVS